MYQWIALLVLVDVIVVAIVVWWIRSKRQSLTKITPGPDLAQLARFSKDVEPQIIDYMAASYRGDPGTLAHVLPGLVSRVERQARAAGIGLGHDALEGLIARALAAQRIADEGDVHRAFEEARKLGAD